MLFYFQVLAYILFYKATCGKETFEDRSQGRSQDFSKEGGGVTLCSTQGQAIQIVMLATLLCFFFFFFERRISFRISSFEYHALNYSILVSLLVSENVY